MAKKPRKPTTVEKKLVGVADIVIDAAERRRDPTIAIPVRSLSNVNFNERRGLIELGKRKQARSFFNVAMAKKFMQTVLVDDGDRVDCTRLGKGGYSVPSIVEPEYLQISRCTADFVLLVEKGTQWNRLSEDKFWRRYNCVLLTGNGQPPRGVRRPAQALHEEYKIPVYVLVDNDPWGYYIYSVIKQGSINLAFESQRMAIPKAKFVGLSSADPDRYGLPRNVGIKLNDKDVGRAKELLKYNWFQKKPWQEEIKRMLGAGLKYELDALANKDFRYLTKTYLPRKLKEEDWLD